MTFLFASIVQAYVQSPSEACGSLTPQYTVLVLASFDMEGLSVAGGALDETVATEENSSSQLIDRLSGKHETSTPSASVQKKAKGCQPDSATNSAVDEMVDSILGDPSFNLGRPESMDYEKQVSLVSVRSDVSESGYMESGQDTEEEESRQRSERRSKQVPNDWAARRLRMHFPAEFVNSEATPHPVTPPPMTGETLPESALQGPAADRRMQDVEDSGYSCDDEDTDRGVPMRKVAKPPSRSSSKRKS